MIVLVTDAGKDSGNVRKIIEPKDRGKIFEVRSKGGLAK
jgi:hypothetical protein